MSLLHGLNEEGVAIMSSNVFRFTRCHYCLPVETVHIKLVDVPKSSTPARRAETGRELPSFDHYWTENTRVWVVCSVNRTIDLSRVDTGDWFWRLADSE